MKENIYRYVVKDTESNEVEERFICSNSKDHSKFATQSYDNENLTIMSHKKVGVLEY